MEAFGEVYLGFTLFYRCAGHGIVLVTEEVVRAKDGSAISSR